MLDIEVVKREDLHRDLDKARVKETMLREIIAIISTVKHWKKIDGRFISKLKEAGYCAYFRNDCRLIASKYHETLGRIEVDAYINMWTWGAIEEGCYASISYNSEQKWLDRLSAFDSDIKQLQQIERLLSETNIVNFCGVGRLRDHLNHVIKYSLQA